MTPVIIIQPHITRQATITVLRILITDRHMKGRSCVAASATTTLTARATTEAEFTASGIK